MTAINVPAFNGIPPLPAGGSQGNGVGSTQAPATMESTQYVGQQPGFVSQVPAPAQPAIDPSQYAAFLEFQKSQVANPAQVANPVAPVTPSYTNPTAILDTVSNATQDAVLSSLTNIFVSTGNGIDIDRALSNALSSGDAKLIDRAYITEKGGANAANLIAVAEGIVQRVQAASQDLIKQTHTAAGGEAQWNSAAAAFNQHAPSHLKTVVSGLLNSGDSEAVKAGTQTIVEFARNGGFSTTPGARVNAQMGVNSSGQGLSKLDFQKAHQALNQNDPSYSVKREALYAQRAAGKAQGL